MKYADSKNVIKNSVSAWTLKDQLGQLHRLKNLQIWSEWAD